jgi:pimeloyl-ACP methyl ester carboxylesterase
MRRLWRAGVVGVAVAGLLVGGPAAGATGSTQAAAGRQSYTGVIDGARYRVEVPARWNGTLLLYSHGYLPAGLQFPGFPLTNRPESEGWLLDHGYALAASQFQNGGTGFLVKQALDDQMAVLDWFTEHVGRPRHTIATGQSMGAEIAAQLAERDPGRFDGVATVCGEYDLAGSWNLILDIDFAVKTLLAPGQDIDVVHPRDPVASTLALQHAVEQAVTTQQGRARLALVAALGDVSGWYSALQPRPTELAEVIRQQAQWIEFADILGLGPMARADLEARAGGNPSSNVGVDYARQLARSSQRDVALRAYREAGLDLHADLDRLAAAPRIPADPAAVRFIDTYGVPRGDAGVPTLTMKTTGDGGAVPAHDRWFAERIRRNGDARDLRQLYVERGMHCSLSAAEELVGLRAVFTRLDTGRWPNLNPRRLNAQAAAYGDPYQVVIDLGTFREGPMPPAFTRYEPPRFLRP